MDEIKKSTSLESLIDILPAVLLGTMLLPLVKEATEQKEIKEKKERSEINWSEIVR